MKKILLISLLFIGCAKHHVEPVFTSMAGTWTFKASTISGEFVIAPKYNDFETVSGNYIISGVSHAVTLKEYVYAGNIDLVEESKSSIRFQSVVVSGDFKSITSQSFIYRIEGSPPKGGLLNEVVTFKRK